MEQVDGGWSWIITCASFVEHFLGAGMIHSIGIYSVYIMDEFDVELMHTSIIAAVYTALFFGGAILLIPLRRRLGYRPIIMAGGVLVFIGYFTTSFVSLFPVLYITMAIIPGIGHALAYATLLIAVDKYFDKKKFIAIAIGTVGGAVGMLTLPIISNYLLYTYGFKGAILVISSLSLNIVLCGAVVFPQKNNQQNEKKRDDRNIQNECKILCKMPAYIAFLIAVFLLDVALYIPSSQLPVTAVSVGVDIAEISFALSMGGISSGLGRFSFGLLSHCLNYHIIKLYIGCVIAMACVMVTVPFSTTIHHFLVFTVLYGFFEGGFSVGCCLSLKNIVTPEQFEIAFTISLVSAGFGCLVGSPLTAFIKEYTENPGTPYYIGSAILFFGAVLMCPFSKRNIDRITDFIIDVKPEGRCAGNVRDTHEMRRIFNTTESIFSNIIIDHPDYIVRRKSSVGLIAVRRFSGDFVSPEQ